MNLIGPIYCGRIEITIVLSDGLTQTIYPMYSLGKWLKKNKNIPNTSPHVDKFGQPMSPIGKRAYT